MTALLARWTEKLAGGPQAGTSNSPPLARVMGVGRQQQQVERVQRGAARFVKSRYSRYSSVSYMLDVLGWPPVVRLSVHVHFNMGL